MNETRNNGAAPRRASSDIGITIGLMAVLVFFIGSGVLSYRNIETLTDTTQQIIHTHAVIAALDDLVSSLKDAETGQRGFILTGDEKYLTPYNEANTRLADEMATLGKLSENEGDMYSYMDELHSHTTAKMAELKETIDLRRAQGFDAALAVMHTDRGKQEMDSVRSIAKILKREESEMRSRRLAEMRGAENVALGTGTLAACLGIALAMMIAMLIRRAATERQRQEWIQTGKIGLATALGGDQTVDELGANALRFLSGYVGAHAGAFFIRDGGSFRRVALLGASTGGVLDQFGENEGMLGRVAREGRAIVIHDISDGYLNVASSFGQGNPRHLVIAPAQGEGAQAGVMEFGFLYPVPDDTVTLMDAVSDIVVVAVKAALYRSSLQNLLEETQRQSEDLQVQSEELRVSNEELEEQSHALQESQARLEQQQAELEQTNASLEGQANILEAQRDELARSQLAVQQKAIELERASQYKSDFLANMSHELRTPLNSSLIMAKLLADNVAGNLSAEQVKYALTIQSSGNDLLTLINDILDLSKIEAGHMEVSPDTTWLSKVAEDMSHAFTPVAQQKNLIFSVHIAAGAPKTIVSDRLRLGQILKNLVSNALKFTEQGSVKVTISASGDKQVAFAVTDTGIGIPESQQKAIFDAFRQADGTISRKFGGTGLGLSISRELARLLGGHIELTSVQGQGSTFTLVMPESYEASRLAVPPQLAGMSAGIAIADLPFPRPDSPTVARAMHPTVEDDREQLAGNGRLILIVEDEESFAIILRDLAHELDFQCLIAATAEDALMLARQYMPCAVMLDIGLPDHSGLLVLDRLKRDMRTRHVPVHVVSANDYAHTAYSMGAVGYMLKPVKRDDLATAMRKLETRLSHRMGRVLIVEDDPVQRGSVAELLRSQDVETVGVGTAAECLELLQTSTFDCMVLDLTLPDSSGYALLETLDREQAYSFPPVIVYTGRDLSSADELKLHRYSRSIIIKGAKSPERLLDEVTLFLHQVVADLPPEQQRMLEQARNRDTVLEGRHILIVEDDIRNVYALTSIFEPLGAKLRIARNGREALRILEDKTDGAVDLVLMDVMMPEMDGLTATREIRKNPAWSKLPVIMLTAKAMKDDQERCIDAGANDYMSKPLDVDKLLSLVRVWMPR
jgi:signal transduction histidine kinase/DNA-binding response OmpR family regulator/CHASE3 domain sensor protein